MKSVFFLVIVGYTLIYALSVGVTTAMWHFLFSLVAFFLLGPKKGWIAAVLYSIMICLVFIMDRQKNTHLYSVGFTMRYCAVFSALTFIAFYYEKVRGHTQKQYALTCRNYIKQNELLNITLDSTADGILVTEKNGVAWLFNRRFQRNVENRK